MEKGRNIRKFSAAELEARRARGEGGSDLARVRAKSAEDLERDIADDPDFRNEAEDWYKAAEAVMPTPKKLLSLRLDDDIIDWFKQQGPGYQTRINAVLRAFVRQQAEKKRA
ncbi:MAG: BrnA antitoxin family protein [Alphaproteobacteria bacterium]|nr:BrnA antitoxin family protein [Alphaproteobacteria bacterium]